MKKIIVNGEEEIMIEPNEPCYLCGGEVYGPWAMFHGAIESQCCGIQYQVKDYSVENVSEHKEEFDLYTKGFKQLGINSKFLDRVKELFDTNQITHTNQITDEMLEA